MLTVDPDWWKTLFDEVYLVTDAPFVCNPTLTSREVDTVEQALHLHPTDRILDLCGGQGRHSLELTRRGYRHLTVLDYTPFLLHLGLHDAAQAGLPVAFCQGDARSTPFLSASFDVVLLMANSFGYFANADDDQQMLAEVARVLAPDGRVLIDLTDHDYRTQHFVPESWYEATDDIVVCWRREMAGNVIRVREMVLSKTKGLLRDRGYAERLYPTERLYLLLKEAGFTDPIVQPNAFVFNPEDGTDYGIATHRMLVTAVKG
ncbi:MAG: class I SAM-dependent methyltransferase [Candidatus Tectomicrobia bacterium]|nr:class I SAM-dependent methyltransferase [Candidatus Tectomicrobia bacterium]